MGEDRRGKENMEQYNRYIENRDHTNKQEWLLAKLTVIPVINVSLAVLKQSSIAASLVSWYLRYTTVVQVPPVCFVYLPPVCFVYLFWFHN